MAFFYDGRPWQEIDKKGADRRRGLVSYMDAAGVPFIRSGKTVLDVRSYVDQDPAAINTPIIITFEVTKAEDANFASLDVGNQIITLVKPGERLNYFVKFQTARDAGQKEVLFVVSAMISIDGGDNYTVSGDPEAVEIDDAKTSIPIVLSGTFVPPVANTLIYFDIQCSDADGGIVNGGLKAYVVPNKGDVASAVVILSKPSEE